MNTINKFAVGVLADKIVILNLPLRARSAHEAPVAADVVGPDGKINHIVGGLPLWPATAPLSHDEALNLAAHLVALTGRRAEFDRLLDAIEAT